MSCEKFRLLNKPFGGLPMTLVLCLFLDVPGFAADLVFSRDVLPILSDKCFHCHGPDSKKARKGNLRLDDEDDAKRDRDGYRVLDLVNPDKSELIARITASDEDDLMPPPEVGRPLSTVQIETLKKWVKQGSRWGRHWAFEKVARPLYGQSGMHPVDQQVDRKLKAESVTANPRADRRTLIRRLKLDLTGLPPTLDQVERFLADNRPGAWDRLVTRTLASPYYGERMAWDWLEAARYADSNGYQGDNERSMWPWRDWVVRAFNDNLPFDDFTIQQLAGDLLPDATQDQILATGFNRNHMINGEGGRIAEENRVDYVFDMTETMGTVWLGLTLNCSRCHDHKFDPLTQREYYEFTAFFNQTPVNGGGGDPATPPILKTGSQELMAEIKKAKEVEVQTGAKVMDREKAIAKGQIDWENGRRQELSRTKIEDWKLVKPISAKSKGQILTIEPSGAVLAAGNNPEKDEYELVYFLGKSEVTAFKLEAVRHPTMTEGRLARSDSGNFVLTDIHFQPKDDKDSLVISGSQATYEQGSHKVVQAYDKDPTTGWAVWNGRTIDRDHAAMFRLKNPLKTENERELSVTLKFNSSAKHHNMGYFRLYQTSLKDPKLESKEAMLLVALMESVGNRTDNQKSLIKAAYEAADSKLLQLRNNKKTAGDRLKQLQGRLAKVMIMKDMAKSRKTYMLDRGLYTKRGEVVSAGVPASLPMFPEGEKNNRLGLAKWLVGRDHPLTARVTVNRYWQMLFGIGFVKTAEDFGVQSEYPVHRELLDWLAAEFMESGWDVKHLIKTIVTSETYRRSSKVLSSEQYEMDPENRLLARGPRFRMPSWMIRDQALASSGILNNRQGGASVNSYQPEGVWEETSFGRKRYTQSKGSALHRRSLYTFWRRIVGPTMFFDSAKRQVCEVKPLRTNTPMHALITMNDVTYVEAARSLAEIILNEEDGIDARLALASKRVLARELSKYEMAIWKRSLERSIKEFVADLNSAKAYLSHGDSKPNEKIDPSELAAWTALCLNFLNLDETLNKE
ncbi:MAG: PSD1 and planctomycete cytochrome C domain-containing protein [Verrucomicrobiota bacterium]|nr:PSD1 and planctomycete cytochrome C domain-containing protein [Verrucomicrobiota bacterium]